MDCFIGGVHALCVVALMQQSFYNREQITSMWRVICEIGPRLNVHISMTLLYTLDAGKMQSYDMTYILIQLLTLIEFKPHQKRQKSNLEKISKANKHQPYYPIQKRICSRQKLLEKLRRYAKENFHLIRQDSHETQTNT